MQLLASVSNSYSMQSLQPLLSFQARDIVERVEHRHVHGDAMSVARATLRGASRLMQASASCRSSATASASPRCSNAAPRNLLRQIEQPGSATGSSRTFCSRRRYNLCWGFIALSGLQVVPALHLEAGIDCDFNSHVMQPGINVAT